MNLEHIKLELESLNEKVKQLEQNQGDSITLTKQQLKQLVDQLIENSMNEIAADIKHNLPSIEEYITLDLYDKEIQIDVDERGIADEIKNNISVREFDQNINSEELVWHRDKEDRIVEVLSNEDWFFQMDNELPIILQEGDVLFIPKGTYHRVKRGEGDLKIKIKEF